jgi:hypothetical protein
MRRRRLIVALVPATLTLGLIALSWTLLSGSSEAGVSSMHNCAPAGKWSIAVWDGDSGTSPADALASCGTDAVDAANSIDPQTQTWSRWFAARPELNNLPPLSDVQGMLALGSAAGPGATATPTPSATPAATPTPTPLVAAPQVRVDTVAEDDQARNTGVMVLCPGVPPLPAGAGAADPDTCNDNGNDMWEDFHASYKLTIGFQGVPVTPTVLACAVVRKDTVSPSAPQIPEEVIASEPTDVSDRFVCISRYSMPGTGFLDVYYTGPSAAEAVGAYELVVEAALTVGSQTYWGTETQDLCALAWPFNDAGANETFSADASTEVGLKHLKRAPQPLSGFASCDDAALFQRDLLGLTIP